MNPTHSLSGPQYLIHGFRLLTRPGLKRFVIIPLLINIILFAGFLTVLQHFFKQFDHWIAQYLPHWLLWLEGLIHLTFYIGFVLVFLYTFVAVANLVSAPFNGFLAEKVEFYLTGKMPTSRTFLDNVKDTPRILARQLALIGYYLPRALILLIFFFVPVIQLVAALLWFGFNAWFMALQYLDYPTDNHQVPLHDVHAFMWQNRLLSLSFGMSILVVTLIPVLNFFVIPAAVAGATELWIEKQQKNSHFS